MIRRAAFWCLCLLAGCGRGGDWDYDAISTYHQEFDSKRLSHRPANGYPPWKIELFKTKDGVDMFASLMQHQFSSLAQNSSLAQVTLSFEGEEEKLEDEAFLFEGKMKVYFSDILTKAFIQALQEGKKVSILINTMQETFEPDSFKENFSKLMKAGYDWEMHLQTPLK